MPEKKALRKQPPPKHLSDDAKAIWRILDKELAYVRGKGDNALLEVFCDTLAIYRAAMAMVRTHGMMIEDTKYGGFKRNPALTAAHQARGSIMKMADQLGLSPAGRDRLGWRMPDDRP
jgi:P27 family predicted phage terminase small subunit